MSTKKKKNGNLNAAKVEKNDEFYTRLQDIEKELFHYKDHFKDKVVLCNCDDPRVSNFFTYFFLNFKFFGLKKLIATCYKNQEWTLFSDGNSEKAVYIVYDGRTEGPMPDDEDIRVMELEGDGDFRSAECRAFLELADIVVTNPPFSLFRDFVALMEKYEKQYIIIGNKNALKYKEIFPLIMQQKLWLGITSPDEFITPDNTITKKVNGLSRWFTNIPLSSKHSKESNVLFRKYSPEAYPKYDNYDAINVDKVADIPDDYFGEIGVPITFLDKWNPNAPKEYEDLVTTNDFDIVGGFNNSNIADKEKYCFVKSTDTPIILNGKESMFNGPVVDKKALYYRIIIKRKR